jgi:hypothetical protein
MHKRRQRRTHLAAFASLVGLMAAAACNPAAQNDARSVGTALAGIQATVEPVATRVAGAVARLQPPDLGRLVGTTLGASVEVSIVPPDAANDQVTQATLTGRDGMGAFAKLDEQARRAVAGASLQLARQAYPRAQIDLTVVDGTGNRLLAASYPPDGQPTFQ